MSNVVTGPFPFERTADGRFAVHLDSNVVVVQSKKEAELLASFAVEYAKIFSDAPRRPDPERVRSILKVCEDYHHRSHAERHLRRWLEAKDEEQKAATTQQATGHKSL